MVLSINKQMKSQKSNNAEEKDYEPVIDLKYCRKSQSVTIY